MSISKWLKAKISATRAANRNSSRNKDDALAKEQGVFKSPSFYGDGDFEKNYQAATQLLKQRMNAIYPDSFHARLGSDSKHTYDHGADRARAVDQVSAAIAKALRSGATVQQAAEAGAESVGL